MKLKIIFLGTPKFGAIILEGFVKEDYKPVLVITSPEKPAGRKQVLTPSPVKITAQENNLSLIQPKRIGEAEKEIEKLKPDLIIVAAYSQILPKKILEIPKYGCLNVHPSLLPKYRGPSPIQTSILNGDKETGETIFLMDEKIDHGPIIASSKHQIANNIYYEELEKELAQKGAKLLIETIPKWINREISPQPQDESKVSHTKLIKKEDGKIGWKKSAEDIERQIRALSPWPGSFTFWKGKIIKILEGEAVKAPPKEKFAVKCGKDYLIIKKLQMEGKKPMKIDDFLRGHYGFNPLL